MTRASISTSLHSRDAVTFYARRLRALAIALADLAETDEMIVTAGGSAFFDQIAEELTTGWPPELDVVPVLGEHPRISGTPRSGQRSEPGHR